MSIWRWYEYDVWGNKKGGYEVNDVFRTGEVIDISDIVLDSWKSRNLFLYLRKIGFIKKGLRSKFLNVNWEEGRIYLDYKGKPVGEFRREK